MASGMNIRLNSQEPLYKELFEKIKEKLSAELSQFDDSLPVYILQIAAIKSYSKEKCCSNLDFLGAANAQGIIDWLWKLMEPYRDGKRDGVAPRPSMPKSVISRESIKKIVKRSEEEREPLNTKKDEMRKRKVPEKEFSEPAPSDRISKLLQRFKEKEAEQEPSKEEKGQSKIISLKRHNNDLRSKSREIPASEPFKRKFQSNFNSRKSKNQHNEKKPNLEQKKFKSDTTEPQKKPESEQEKAQSEQKPDQLDKKKIRCKKWPACKDESCPYVHPKEICKNFPNCKYGNRCLNIHPQTPCKFGMYCTRPDCAFTHPPRLMEMSMFSMPFSMFGGRPKNMQARYKSSKSIPNEDAKPEEKHP